MTNPERFYFHSIPYIRESDYIAVVADMLRLRDKLMECAKECSRCDGAGLITIHGGGSGDPEWDADDQPCPDCADIRELLS